MAPLTIIPKEYYMRRPDIVARDLLGKKIVRVLNGERLEGIVVETEAYHGQMDPASRAFHGRKNYNKMMWDEPGHLFIYNVHKYWMLNVVAHDLGGVGGVLFRAIEPVKGIKTMERLRPIDDEKELTSGPGKLSIALGISKELNGFPVTDPGSPVQILDAPYTVEICTSHRIGVKRDLPEKLRFYIKGNMFVSRE
jgi:DNA-3-methyladenine glycosylase